MKKSIDIVHRIDELAFEGVFSNKEMVQIIELLGDYLNIQTISDYARNNDMSYNGVKKYRNIKTIFNTKFVIDND